MSELRTLFALVLLFWRLRPALVHLVTIKPVVYGGLAARLSPVKAVVAAISGLGTVFLAEGWLARLRRSLVVWMYQGALGGRRVAVIFQNEEDRRVLLREAGLARARIYLIPGSGVSLADFRHQPEPSGRARIIMASRLLVDKGVRDYVEAAGELRRRGVEASCILVGEPDPGNPNTISEQEFRRWREEGVVECLGFRTDIAELFSLSHIVVLPSYYGEGLPKVLVEAAACGRAVVTTDHPGCRDAIVPGRSGVLVPPRYPAALADALEYLVRHPEVRMAMGQEGRRLAERCFAIEQVVTRHLDIYREVLDD